MHHITKKQDNAVITADSLALKWQSNRITPEEKAYCEQEAAKFEMDKAAAQLAIHAIKPADISLIHEIARTGGEQALTALHRVVSTCSLREISSLSKSCDNPLLGTALKAASVTATAKKIIIHATAALGCHVISEPETMQELTCLISEAIEKDYAGFSPKEFTEAIAWYSKRSSSAQTRKGEEKQLNEYRQFSRSTLDIIMAAYGAARGKFLLSVPNLMEAIDDAKKKEEKEERAEKIEEALSKMESKYPEYVELWRAHIAREQMLAAMSPDDRAFFLVKENFQKVCASGDFAKAIFGASGRGVQDQLCEYILRLIKEGEIIITEQERSELMEYTHELLLLDYKLIKGGGSIIEAAAQAQDSPRSNRTTKMSSAFGLPLPSGFNSALVALWLATPYAQQTLAANKTAKKPDPLFSTFFSIYMLKLTYQYAVSRAIIASLAAI